MMISKVVDDLRFAYVHNIPSSLLERRSDVMTKLAGAVKPLLGIEQRAYHVLCMIIPDHHIMETQMLLFSQYLQSTTILLSTYKGKENY